MNPIDFISDTTATDVVDIGIVAILLYAMMAVLRRTNTSFVALGILFVGALYVVALTLGLRLTSYLLNTFFTVIFVALLIIFQDELRSFFSRLASTVLRRRRREQRLAFSSEIDRLADTLFDMAAKHIGAIVVIPGDDDIDRHLQRGTRLDGRLSDALLRSIFDPHSVGHDGAVILRGATVEKFACHLPLATNAAQLGDRGTRHAAALGLSERCDALCIVVSEERGVVSVAHQGVLTVMESRDALRERLDALSRAAEPKRAARIARDVLVRDWSLKLGAVALALPLWFLFVHESEIAYRTFDVPLQPTGLPPHLRVASVEPQSVRVVVTAPRRKFYFVTTADFQIGLRLFDARAGERVITLTASDAFLPDDVTFVNIIPRDIRVKIEPVAQAKPKPPEATPVTPPPAPVTNGEPPNAAP